MMKSSQRIEEKVYFLLYFFYLQRYANIKKIGNLFLNEISTIRKILRKNFHY